jgi:hypothetical protein
MREVMDARRHRQNTMVNIRAAFDTFGTRATLREAGAGATHHDQDRTGSPGRDGAIRATVRSAGGLGQRSASR